MLIPLYIFLILLSPFVLIVYGGLYVLPKLLAKLTTLKLQKEAQPQEQEPRSQKDKTNAD